MFKKQEVQKFELDLFICTPTVTRCTQTQWEGLRALGFETSRSFHDWDSEHITFAHEYLNIEQKDRKDTEYEAHKDEVLKQFNISLVPEERLLNSMRSANGYRVLLASEYSQNAHLLKLIEAIPYHTRILPHVINNSDFSPKGKGRFEALLTLISDIWKSKANAGFYQEQEYNKKVNVHVPGDRLLSISEVTYGNDMCTEELQEKLDEGWHILSICPQPDQRRPDYILGKKGSN
ncbi:hypothetical protein [Cognatishimia sp.]|uniref:hypothetical protein n=1 Tax=Cognatishimia sp. TaxID=2211648 RepID=UPI0035164B7A|nr:hypothetical protein [Cognatishimia sp.]